LRVLKWVPTLGLTAVCVFATTVNAVAANGAGGSDLLPVDRTVVAQAFGSGVIRDIVVEGNQRIERATVLSHMTVKAGDRFDADKVDASLKALFATTLFQDVVMKRRGDTLVIAVVENPIINRVAFEGNRKFNDERLGEEVQIKPRQVLTRTKVQDEARRVVDLYRRQGRFAASVEPKTIQLDQNRVDLVFEINEGPRSGIRSINFVGNEEFSAGTLRENILTKESAWYRILSNDDNYDPDRLTYDREMLRRFYLKEGYADFRVLSAVAELTPDRQDFVVTFSVDEGPRYTFGKVDVKSTLKGLDPEAVRSKVITSESDWYDATAVDDSVDALARAVSDLQHSFVDVQPRVNRDREKRTIDITYEIGEGQRSYVERINVTGNLHTMDEVVRREMALVEGDPFSAAKLKRSEQRVRDLGFFERVETTTEQGSAPDRAVVNVDVSEQSTGAIILGAGYSTSDGVLGDISFQEKNLLGKGQYLKVGTTLSFKSQEIDLSFTEPYFLGRDLATGFDVFRVSKDYQDESSYDIRNTGFVLRTAYPLTDSFRQKLYYRMQYSEIYDVADTASVYVKSEAGKRLTSLVGQELSYDALDSRLDPSDGWYTKLITDVAGLGGDDQYLRARLSGGYFLPLSRSKDWVVSATAEVGNIQNFGDRIALSDRFFLGGDTLRGFKSSGVGPRDVGTDDALGGKRFARGSVEVGFPLGLPAEVGLRGYTFMDVGMVSDSGVSGTDVKDESDPRMSIGAGLAWKSPMGPIKVDMGFPVMKQNYDKTQAFRFSFGTRF